MSDAERRENTKPYHHSLNPLCNFFNLTGVQTRKNIITYYMKNQPLKIIIVPTSENSFTKLSTLDPL